MQRKQSILHEKGGLYSIQVRDQFDMPEINHLFRKIHRNTGCYFPPPKKGTIMRELNPYQFHDYFSHCMRHPVPFSRVLTIPGWFDGNDGKSLPTAPLVKLWRVGKKVMWVREDNKEAVQGTTMNINLGNHSIPPACSIIYLPCNHPAWGLGLAWNLRRFSST